MKRLVLDIETNGLLYDWQLDPGDTAVLDRVWCLCAIDAGTKEEFRWTLGDVKNAIKFLETYDELIGHDLQAFDLRVLKHLYNGPSINKIFDTKIAARCIFPDTKSDDWRSSMYGTPWKTLPKSLWGSHTLQAWGLRIGVAKGDRGSQDFSRFSEEMVDYCMQDCRVTLALYEKLMEQKPAQAMLDLEHEFSRRMDEQRANGFKLDLPAVHSLTEKLQIQRLQLEGELKTLFPPRTVEYLTPVKKLVRTKEIIFNPASRDQIAWNLTNKYGWKPAKFTEGGKPQVDESVLAELDYPEAKRLSEYLLIQKRIGQIAEGDRAWLKLVRPSGRIHGGVNTNGTVTGRCAHVNPNLGQVPRVGKPFGKECRAVFCAEVGNDLVGCDAAGLQLRLLAHLLARYDEGAYTQVVTTGDPHERNRQAAGLESRDQAKTFIYALLFGAGPDKIGRIVGADAAAGRRLLKTFFRSIPAFRRLLDDIGTVIRTRKTLQGLDGRRYPIRSTHVGLNVLLMGYEAVVMKQAVCMFHRKMEAKGFNHGSDYKQVAFVHDEIQVEAPPPLVVTVGEALAESIKEAGEFYKLRCPLVGKWKSGKNWAETH